jgi:5-(carboxyamino)imidazole ribonucleotide synthase
VKHFPTVGVIGPGHLAQLTQAPAAALGIDFISVAISKEKPATLEVVREFARKCDVVTFEHDEIPISVVKTLESEGVKFLPSSSVFQYLLKQTPKLLLDELIDFEFEIAVIVARSPHGQAATWAPTLIVKRDGIFIETVTPVPEFSEAQSSEAQNLALQIAEEIKLVGVMTVEMFVKGNQILINQISLSPNDFGNWTIEGSVTSQFEQHLRAILDLPLGDTSITSKWVVLGNIYGSDKSDMFRPYLHLLARTPALKFHYYGIDSAPGRKIGHITLMGDEPTHLRNEVDHALAYLCGEVDE